MTWLDRSTGISRRELLQDATVAGAGAALASTPAIAAAMRNRRRRPSVAVLGGGMAGLAAAHELIERGFEVTVYERKALGGKARSIPVPGSARGGRRPLPGEHGFRFFPGFYHHVPDSMRRIPFSGNPNGVWDNLTAATEGKFIRANGRADGGPFGIGPDAGALLTVNGLSKQLYDSLRMEGVPPHELAFFVNRVMVFLTSSDERRFGQWELTSWWDFIEADGKSQEYKTVIASGLTRNVVAAKETVASTRTIGHMAEAFIMNIMGRGNDGAVDRVLNAPTNEAWIRPWVRHLHELGVRFRIGVTIDELRMRGDRVASASGRNRHGRRREIEADWFVCAMPVERARQLWSSSVLDRDPGLKTMDDLFYDWMNGLQFYLREKIEITHGHIAFIDAPWALTALTQAQFWPDRDFPADYGDGSAVDCLSVDISDWDTAGILYGKPAKRCTEAEIKREVWAQIKEHQTAGDQLEAGILHSSFLDPAISWNRSGRRNRNAEPLLVNTVGSWEKRPTAVTAISNLFLGGDYVQTDLDLATMEGANESGRAAVNGLLAAAGSSADGVTMYTLYRPPEFEALKAADAELYRAGRPNALDP